MTPNKKKDNPKLQPVDIAIMDAEEIKEFAEQKKKVQDIMELIKEFELQDDKEFIKEIEAAIKESL